MTNAAQNQLDATEYDIELAIGLILIVYSQPDSMCSLFYVSWALGLIKIVYFCSISFKGIRMWMYFSSQLAKMMNENYMII